MTPVCERQCGRGDRPWTIAAALAVTVAIALAGCSSTRLVSRHNPLEPIGKATVVLKGGARIAAASLTTQADTVILRDYSTRRELRFPFAEVERATTRDWAAGFLPGLVKGAAVGGSIGVVLGVIAGTSDSGDGGPYSEGAYSDPYSLAIILGGMGFLIGAPIGGIAGVARGRTTYNFVHAPPPASSVPLVSKTEVPPPRAGGRR